MKLPAAGYELNNAAYWFNFIKGLTGCVLDQINNKTISESQWCRDISNGMSGDTRFLEKVPAGRLGQLDVYYDKDIKLEKKGVDGKMIEENILQYIARKHRQYKKWCSQNKKKQTDIGFVDYLSKSKTFPKYFRKRPNFAT